MIDPELERIAVAITRDPHDVLSIQALADRVEELGGQPERLRALTVDDGDIIVFTASENAYPLTQEQADGLTNAVRTWFEQFDKDVWCILLPRGHSVATIKRGKGKE